MMPFTVTPKSITFVLDNRLRHLDTSHTNFEAVKARLKTIQYTEIELMNRSSTVDGDATPLPSIPELLDGLRDLVDIPSFIAKVSLGRVKVSDDKVLFDGTQVHGHIAERLLGLLREGFDVRPLMRFMERLHTAPIKGVQDQFLRWLEASKLPLTEDGCFIAYKYVKSDYTDGYTGRIDNSIGAVIPRLAPNSINTNRNVTCAESGYHFCSFGYLGGSHPHVMLVKIAPEDVASFPDGEIAKGRCLFYEIIGEVPADELQARRVESTPVYLGSESDMYHYGEETDEFAFEVDVAVAPEEDDPPIRTYVAPVPANGKTGRDRWVERLKGVEFGGKRLTPKRLGKLLTKHGQRETSRLTGIPRSTLQGWIE